MGGRGPRTPAPCGACGPQWSHKTKSVATRFLLPVTGLGLLFVGFDLYWAYRDTEEHVTELMSQQAALALEFDLAIRSYVAEEIRPAMQEKVGPDEVAPETMSTSFVARRIFDKVRNKIPDYVIKFSSDDARNPANQAGQSKGLNRGDRSPRLSPGRSSAGFVIREGAYLSSGSCGGPGAVGTRCRYTRKTHELQFVGLGVRGCGGDGWAFPRGALVAERSIASGEPAEDFAALFDFVVGHGVADADVGIAFAEDAAGDAEEVALHGGGDEIGGAGETWGDLGEDVEASGGSAELEAPAE